MNVQTTAASDPSLAGRLRASGVLPRQVALTRPSSGTPPSASGATSRRSLAHLAARIAVVGGIAVASLGPAGVALAHERRVVGSYALIVGYLVEPAYVGDKNAIELKVLATGTNEPVDGLEKTLKAAIAFGGGQFKEFPLRPWPGTPGGYLADVIPTRVGSYRFRFTGTVGTTKIDEEFESGPGRFADVEVADKLQFPEVVAAPAQVAQAAKRAEERAAAAEAALDTVAAQASAARTFGIAGVLAGVAGLAVAGWSMIRRR